MTETIRTDNSETLKNALLRIKALEEQIEKMRCCENCKHHSFWGDELKCNLDLDTQFKCLHTKEKWEFAE